MARKRIPKSFRAVLAALCITTGTITVSTFLAACGGGGDAKPAAPPPPTPSDTTPAMVVAVHIKCGDTSVPGVGATGIPTTGCSIVYTFDETLACTRLPTSVVFESKVAGQPPIPATLACSGITLTATPTVALPTSPTVVLAISGVPNLAGLTSAEHSFSFSTMPVPAPVGLILSESSPAQVNVTEPSELGRFAATCVNPTGCNIVGLTNTVGILQNPGTSRPGVSLTTGNFLTWERWEIADTSNTFTLDPSNPRTKEFGRVPNGQTVRYFFVTGGILGATTIRLTSMTVVDDAGKVFRVGGKEDCKAGQLITQVACPSPSAQGSGTASASYSAVINAP